MQRIGFESADGVTGDLYVDLGADEGAPVLWLQPAMGIRAEWYFELVEPARSRGWRLAVADLRGHGTSSVRPSRAVDFGYREIVEFDLPAQHAALTRAVTGPIVVAGHSLGGHVALLFACRRPQAVRGVALIASCSVHHVHWGRRAPTLWLGTRAARVTAEALGWFPGETFGFGGREARGLIKDWARMGATGDFKSRGIDYEVDLVRGKTPALFLSIDSDPLAPPRAVDALCRKIPRRWATRSHVAVEGKRAHFDWTRAPDPVLDALTEWWKTRAARTS